MLPCVTLCPPVNLRTLKQKQSTKKIIEGPSKNVKDFFSKISKPILFVPY